MDGKVLYSQPVPKWKDSVLNVHSQDEAAVAATTIYGLEWGVVIVDEVHAMHTHNKFYTAACMARHKSEMAIGMSAMPSITSPMVSHLIKDYVC